MRFWPGTVSVAAEENNMRRLRSGCPVGPELLSVCGFGVARNEITCSFWKSRVAVECHFLADSNLAVFDGMRWSADTDFSGWNVIDHAAAGWSKSGHQVQRIILFAVTHLLDDAHPAADGNFVFAVAFDGGIGHSRRRLWDHCVPWLGFCWLAGSHHRQLDQFRTGVFVGRSWIFVDRFLRRLRRVRNPMVSVVRVWAFLEDLERPSIALQRLNIPRSTKKRNNKKNENVRHAISQIIYSNRVVVHSQIRCANLKS